MRCDDGCACSTAADAARDVPTVVPLTVRRPAAGETPIACTLDAGLRADRVADWQAVVSRATSRKQIPGGVALRFAPDGDGDGDGDGGDGDGGGTGLLAVELARLAAAEQACCTFFDFTLAVAHEGVRFEVRAPDDAHGVLAALFGTPGPAA